MSTSTFSAGAVVEIDGRRQVLLRKVDSNLWQLEDERTKRISELTDHDLGSAYASGTLRFVEPFQSVPAPATLRHDPVDYPPQLWERAKVRRMYVLAILDLPGTRRTIRPVIQATWESLRQPARVPCATMVLQWKSAYLKAGRDITALIERHASKGNRKSRYPPEVEQIIKDSIDSRYATLHRGTIQDVVDDAMASVARENALRPPSKQLSIPTRRLTKRLIGEIPAFELYAARYGRLAAERRFRSVLSHRTTRAPLERAEIDHTLLDLFVIDDSTRLPLGRPWLTVCIDDYSRCILGIYVGFEPPSYFTVARCLKQALVPKAWLREKYPALRNVWAAHGVMRELVVDNGVEFHSTSLENACLSLGIEIHYAPRKVPWFKGKVERVIGTMNRGVAHGRPGTTFANILEKSDYDPSKHAVIRYSTLLEVTYKWIVDIYHDKPHRALGAPPAAVWTKSMAPEDIRVPSDPDRLDALLGRSESRMVSHKGIELNGLLYNSPELTALRRRLGNSFEVDIRVDPTDIGSIVVITPKERDLIRAHALATEYAAGLSERQHKIVRSYAARELGRADVGSWREAKREIAELIEREFMHKKLKSRKHIARYQGIGPEQASVSREPTLAADAAKARTAPALLTSTDSTAAAKGAAEAPKADRAPSEGKVYPLATDAPIRKYTALYRDRSAADSIQQEE